MQTKNVVVISVALALLLAASPVLNSQSIDIGIQGVECKKVESGTEHLFYFKSTTGKSGTIRATDASVLENCAFAYRFAKFPVTGGGRSNSYR